MSEQNKIICEFIANYNLSLTLKDQAKYSHQLNLIIEYELQLSFKECINDLSSYLEENQFNLADSSDKIVYQKNIPDSFFQLTNYIHKNEQEISYQEFSTLLSPQKNELYKWFESAKHLCTIFILKIIKQTSIDTSPDITESDFINKQNDISRLLTIFASIKIILEQFIHMDYDSDFIFDIDTSNSNPLTWKVRNNNSTDDSPYEVSIKQIGKQGATENILDYFIGSPNKSDLKVPDSYQDDFNKLAKKIKDGEDPLVSPYFLSIILHPKDKYEREKEEQYLCFLLDDKYINFYELKERALSYTTGDTKQRYKKIKHAQFYFSEYIKVLKKQAHGMEIFIDLGEKHGCFPLAATSRTNSFLNDDRIEALTRLVCIWNNDLRIELPNDKKYNDKNKNKKNEIEKHRFHIPLTSVDMLRALKKYDKCFKNLNHKVSLHYFWKDSRRSAICSLVPSNALKNSQNKEVNKLLIDLYINKK